MERVGDHPVPVGPLAVRWLAVQAPPLRAGEAGVATVRLENAGSATWRSHRKAGIQAATHWLDPLGNPIVWDGERTAFAGPVPPGAQVELALNVVAPRPPGAYRLAFDLIEEHRFWFAEFGSSSWSYRSRSRRGSPAGASPSGCTAATSPRRSPPWTPRRSRSCSATRRRPHT